MKKIIHLFPAEKFTVPYIMFANEKLRDYNNIFWVYRTSIDIENEINGFDNVVFGSRTYFLKKVFMQEMAKCDAFFVHCYGTLAAFMLMKKKEILKKTGVVFWGCDLYEHHQVIPPGLRKFKWRVTEFSKKRTLCDIGLCMTFANKDYELAKEYYGICCEHKDILYPETVNLNVIDDAIENSRQKRDDNIRIIIGNSATPSMRHIDVLNKIAIFKNENIEVYIPLSYGDADYGARVREMAVNIFGHKVKILDKFMKPDEYTQLLSTMDVAIFNNLRQQASQNIEILAYSEAKIYMDSSGVPWEYYVMDKGLHFFDINDDQNYRNLDDFVSISLSAKEQNKDYFRRCWDMNYIKSLWEDSIERLTNDRVIANELHT